MSRQSSAVDGVKVNVRDDNFNQPPPGTANWSRYHQLFIQQHQTSDVAKLTSCWRRAAVNMTDSDAPITPLARPVSTRLRSALIIPTLPQILNELVQNALDAGCTRVDCYIDLSAGNESMRVEDDGHGLDSEALKHVGVRYGKRPYGDLSTSIWLKTLASSKERADAALTPITGYGFRGEGELCYVRSHAEIHKLTDQRYRPSPPSASWKSRPRHRHRGIAIPKSSECVRRMSSDLAPSS